MHQSSPSQAQEGFINGIVDAQGYSTAARSTFGLAPSPPSRPHPPTPPSAKHSVYGLHLCTLSRLAPYSGLLRPSAIHPSSSPRSLCPARMYRIGVHSLLYLSAIGDSSDRLYETKGMNAFEERRERCPGVRLRSSTLTERNALLPTANHPVAQKYSCDREKHRAPTEPMRPRYPYAITRLPISTPNSSLRCAVLFSPQTLPSVQGIAVPQANVHETLGIRSPSSSRCCALARECDPCDSMSASFRSSVVLCVV
ncbi:hypothetical protein NMY22_g13423 [Coprinellus aureogranulatus]|nr:hypothetical protein NMY22_g13423 [Coprinellus aureogranulatus]